MYKIELVKKGLGKIIGDNFESPIVSLPMEVEDGDLAEIEFDENFKFKKFIVYSPKKYYGVVIGNFEREGGIILVTYPDLIGTIVFKKGVFKKGSKVEFRVKKTFKGMESIDVSFTKEFYKCVFPSFGKIEKRILKPKYGVIEDVIKNEKNIIEGEVKSFGNKGFGFIRSLDGDIFFYGLPISKYEKFFKKSPEIGDMVYYIEYRRDVITILLQKYKLNLNEFDINYLVQISKDRTGAEIEQGIIEAKYNAFDEEREVNTKDIDTALRATAPIWNNFQRVIQTPEYQQIIRNAKLASDYSLQRR